MEDSARDCRRAAGAASDPRRRHWHLYSGSDSTFLYYLLGGGDLLRSEPQTGIFDRASVGVRFVLWHGGGAVKRHIVLPPSAPSSGGPYELHDVILGLVVHMVVVGLPISFS